MAKLDFSLGDTLLVTIDPGSGDVLQNKPVARYACLKGNLILKEGTCSVGELTKLPGKDRRFSFFSNLCFFERSELAVPKENMLELAARRFVDGESVFTEPYRVRCRVVSKVEKRFQADIAAIPETDFKQSCDDLNIEEQPAGLLVTRENAIAALIGRVTSEPVIVFWAGEESFFSLLVENGSVLAQRVEQPDPDLALYADSLNDNPYKTLLDAGERAMEMAARHARMDVFLRLKLGRLHPAFPKSDDDKPALDHEEEQPELPEIQEPSLELESKPGESAIPTLDDLALPDKADSSKELEEKLLQIFAARQATDESCLSPLFYPEVFGLPFVNPSLNFLDSAYQHRIKAYKLAMPVAVAIVFCSLIIAVLGGFRLYKAVAMQDDFQLRKENISRGIAALAPRIPDPKTLETLQTIIDLSEREKNELRVDRFLAWLSNGTPAGVFIRKLTVKPEGPETGQDDDGFSGAGNSFQRETRFGSPSGEQPSESKLGFEVEIQAVIRGNYEQTKKLSVQFVRELSKKTKLSNSNLIFTPDADGEDGVAVFSSSLVAMAGDI